MNSVFNTNSDSYLAHIAENGDVQTVEEHLNGTAELAAEFAKSFGDEEQGRLLGLAHDIGKYSDEFQERLHGGKKVDHSTAGALECAKLGMDWAPPAIAGHHGGLPDVGNGTDMPGEGTVYARLKNAIKGGIPVYHWKGNLPRTPNPRRYGKDGFTDSFIIRMLYSCLVDADFLDTESFMSGGKTVRPVSQPICKLLDRLDKYTAPWFPPKNEINRQRCKILNDCIEASSQPKGIYTLTVPTGGGKTVSSLAFALHHAAEHNMQRVIYVIPYTSIIEQNADVFRKILGEDAVLEHHSGVSYDDEKYDAESVLRRSLASENWDCPVVVTTAVQFFESLYAAKPSKCRKLHNIANSVIIFDEAQKIPDNHLRPCIAAICQLVKNFGSTAVFCTATQPFVEDLIHDYAPSLRTYEICPDAKSLFENFKRVSFQNAGTLEIESLASDLKSREQVLCVVNARKTAQEIFNLLPQDGSFHLSTFMYPAHRRAVLDEIRRRLKDGEPCRVVSTSLIEAGVDIDFLLVYRELAGLDSILQAAGRCNREARRNPDESIVTIFELDKKAPLLFASSIGAAREILASYHDLEDPETVTAFFKSYRSLIGDNLDKNKVVEHMTNGISGCKMPFTTVAENFHLIENATKSVYIPLGKGKELIKRIIAGEVSRELFREAAQYAVSVYDKDYADLAAQGVLMPFDDAETAAYLLSTDVYDSKTGLKINECVAGGLYS